MEYDILISVMLYVLLNIILLIVVVLQHCTLFKIFFKLLLLAANKLSPF